MKWMVYQLRLRLTPSNTKGATINIHKNIHNDQPYDYEFLSIAGDHANADVSPYSCYECEEEFTLYDRVSFIVTRVEDTAIALQLVHVECPKRLR